MFWFTVFSAAILRIYLISRDSIPFAYDMGRDLLWAKDISFYKIPTLIGPAASIWGVYFGPLWFYFLSIPLLVTNGNPLSAVFATASVVILTGVLSFYLFKNHLQVKYSFLLAILILFSATSTRISSFAFHANVLPFLTLLSVYFLFLTVVRNIYFLPLSALTISLMFHADPAPGIVFSLVPVPIIFFFKLIKRKNFFRSAICSALVYTLPFLPQIIFEFRNNFIETKSLISYFAGENPSLSGQLPVFLRVKDRLFLFFDFLNGSFTGGFKSLTLILLVLLVIGIHKFLKENKNKNLRTLAQLTLLITITVFLVFTFFITVEVKTWYLYGLLPSYALLVTTSIIGLNPKRSHLMFFILFFVALNLYPFFKQTKELSKKDPARLSNQLEVISIIYSDKPSEFSVYTFTPSIYDYHYQYLFWWKGERLKMGFPKDFAYLPDIPTYVRNKENYAKSQNPTNTIYLIIENGKENQYYTKESWLKKFRDYELVWQKDINGALELQKRRR